MSLEDDLNEFRKSVGAILAASKTPHVSASCNGRVRPGAFEGGRINAPAKPTIDADPKKLKEAFVKVFAAYDAANTALFQMSFRAERDSKKAAWHVRTFPLLRAKVEEADMRRRAIDEKVVTTLLGRGASGEHRGWERLSLTQDANGQRFLRRMPGAKPEDIPVDPELKSLFEAAAGAYKPVGFKPASIRWDVVPQGDVEVTYALEPA